MATEPSGTLDGFQLSLLASVNLRPLRLPSRGFHSVSPGVSAHLSCLIPSFLPLAPSVSAPHPTFGPPQAALVVWMGVRPLRGAGQAVTQLVADR